MSIREILDTEFEQECESCGAIRKIPDSDVAVGVERDGQTDTKVIPLPACPNCGSREFLLRSADDEPEHPSPGSFGHRHRLMVDVLHNKLVKKGRVSEGIDSQKAQGRKRPKKELDKWFKDGMKIRRPKENPEENKEEPSPEIIQPMEEPHE